MLEGLGVWGGAGGWGESMCDKLFSVYQRICDRVYTTSEHYRASIRNLVCVRICQYMRVHVFLRVCEIQIRWKQPCACDRVSSSICC